jgi:hypothetical protein
MKRCFEISKILGIRNIRCKVHNPKNERELIKYYYYLVLWTNKTIILYYIILYLLLRNRNWRSRRRGHDRMVVGFTTTCAISPYHH